MIIDAADKWTVHKDRYRQLAAIEKAARAFVTDLNGRVVDERPNELVISSGAGDGAAIAAKITALQDALRDWSAAEAEAKKREAW